MQEATGQSVAFSGIPSGSLGIEDTTKQVRLESISDIKGINALSPTKPLSFGKQQLCIVYGQNGAGKSGYVRLLKHVCGSRQPGDLLDDVFCATPQSQSAEITFTIDTQTKPVRWTGDVIFELKGVEIYDTDCGLIYITEENEVAFEPWLLRLFSQLTNTCTTLQQHLQEKIDGLISKKPIFPAEFATTTTALWYSSLTYTIERHEIDDKTDWRPEDEIELTDFNRRLAEPNPAAKAAALRRQKELVLGLAAELKRHFKSLSDENYLTYLSMKSDATDKRKVADEDANRVFEKAPLSGVGSETWRLLWEAARQYSQEYAYQTKPFPNTEEGSHCVLCQRELDKESIDRFISFENFVKGELQRLALEAEKNLQKTADTITPLSSAEEVTMKLEAAGITDESAKSSFLDLNSQLAQRRQTFLSSDNIADVLPLPSKEQLVRLIQIARNLEKQARTYDKDAELQNRPQLIQKSKELLARKWLNQQRPSIEDEITRLKTVFFYEQAIRLTNTKALSQRKSILTDELITKAYKQRFQDELKHLGASNIKISLDKSRAEVGRVYHRISLKEAQKKVNPSEILSEGELRIVSLAAFLADTMGRDPKTPFIFDDPISSLDHIYEEVTARRLIELSESRQVIVFTHRLSLISALEKYAEKHYITHDILCLSKYTTGEVVDMPIEFRKTDKAANALRNERLAAAKKAFAQGEEAYESEAKSICRDVRVLLERVVETDLLSGIVKRFSPEVNTKGKIHNLAKITSDDCNLVDEYMTKYSRFEHSQSEEIPVPLPKPDEIEADITKISTFIESLKKRTKS